MKSDKELERDRFEARAQAALAGSMNYPADQALASLPRALLSPYLFYEAAIRENLTDEAMNALELGAGTGLFTEMGLKTGARILATDISASALEVLTRRVGGYPNIETRVADMESLPFDDESFDVVLCAGSLSYGDNEIVMNEIYRVTRPGGKFICVDSLDENPIYRLNRWLQYLGKRRSRSTIERMPDQALLNLYGHKFGKVAVRYFGSVTWAFPILNIFLSPETVAKISDRIDGFLNASRSAFKFVMVAEKTR